MLKAREADIPALFVVLVVLPIVAYILLGKWNEVSKKKAKISMLAQIAAEEALRVEAMVSSDALPVVSSLKSGTHLCAKCCAPARTRCSRCKSVRYCSGKCQIVHWRQGHKQECQQWQTGILNFSTALGPMADSVHRGPFTEPSRDYFENNTEEHLFGNGFRESPFDPHIEKKLSDHVKRVRDKPKREIFINDANTRLLSASSELSAYSFLKDSAFKSTDGCFSATNEDYRNDLQGIPTCVGVRNSSSQYENMENEKMSLYKPKSPTNLSEKMLTELQKSTGESISTSLRRHSGSPAENARIKCALNKVNHEDEDNAVKGSILYRKPPYTLDSHKSSARVQNQCQSQSQMAKRKSETEADSRSPQHVPVSISEQSCKGISNKEGLTMEASRNSSKILKKCLPGLTNGCKKIKVLFPYEELVKLFQCEVSGISPRGLLNCGNSCYANVVLQCLTFTKPLMVYLLRRSHSKTCRIRDWCLMCELEQHTVMLLEGGGPLSPGNILSNMSVGCRMGGGNQEDAHEFLRLLVMSMQAVCLEDEGGEKKVDIGMQETTLVQQIFGGRLKSKVKCLKCHQESERYENIMDLTLEIFGWVESLEDALTQFTAPEDLDGENMYRCGRCSAYVRARKQLSLHEVPNILTIVLKRFQTGKYGKINKCVTFPDLLDMIPFVTGSADSPPLYMLYAVVVHLDTLNTSFSGHYVSYVKDIQGTWYRIDDSEVQVVPSSQVMSEGAYMLFYSRCFPRPPRAYMHRSPTQCPLLQHGSRKLAPSSKHEQDKEKLEFWPEKRREDVNSNARFFVRKEETRADPANTDFSDATSSEWSLFTSSDDSSFTTESTRDSFSTNDHGDSPGLDTISSIFGPFYMPESSHRNTISCTKSSFSSLQTRFHGERLEFVADSSATARRFRQCI